jgi:hypothetical protein
MGSIFKDSKGPVAELLPLVEDRPRPVAEEVERHF